MEKNSIRGKNLFVSLIASLVSGLLVVVSFPDFDLSFFAWIALVPLFISLFKTKGILTSIISGWLFGLAYFGGTCWWLTFAPIHYAGFPPLLAYLLLVTAAGIVAIFPAVFAAILKKVIDTTGPAGIFAAPFFWTALEFARFWLTGNNWNAIAYSQAFNPKLIASAAWTGIYSVSFSILFANSMLSYVIIRLSQRIRGKGVPDTAAGRKKPFITLLEKAIVGFCFLYFLIYFSAHFFQINSTEKEVSDKSFSQVVVAAIQPNVPASGLDEAKWERLKERQFEMARQAVNQIRQSNEPKARANEGRPAGPTARLIIFPESPMNYAYSDDLLFQAELNQLAIELDSWLLLNSAEPSPGDVRKFNSAILISPEGKLAGQYDKIHLLPFGEAVPFPFEGILPAFVGSFAYGSEFDIFNLGFEKFAVMICFESHFGLLSREYAKNGADFLVEMTNDGYLGQTPVLRQHLANAVFRAVETKRPLIRATNVGITAIISSDGTVSEALPAYSEGLKIWPVKGIGKATTLYVAFGDWFAWMCCLISVLIGSLAFRKGRILNIKTSTELP
jgi:apolipoprotein N-acyltransferase